MNVHYISSNIKYTSENDEFKKNGTLLTNEDGEKMKATAFNALIKKEISSFIHKAYNNIIVLIGAGASVLCTSVAIDNRFGKTVSMLAELINAEIKLDPYFSGGSFTSKSSFFRKSPRFHPSWKIRNSIS